MTGKNPKNARGKSPFHKALEAARKKPPSKEERMRRIKRLKAEGFDVDGFMRNTNPGKKRNQRKKRAS